jgi:uncharacterized repeat protein (TIGR03803 family)
MRHQSILCLALVVSGAAFGGLNALSGEKGPMGAGPGPCFESYASFNGKQLLIGDTLWDVKTGKRLKEFLSRPASVSAATFSPDGGQVLAAIDGGLFGEPAALWDVATGREIRRLTAKDGDNPSSVQFSPDGRRILTAFLGGTNQVQIWDANSGRRLLVLQGLQPPTTRIDSCVSFNPDGRRVLVLGWRKVTVWDVTSGAEVCTIKQPDKGKPDFFESAEFSPDGKLVLTEQWNGITEIWDANTGGEAQSFTVTNRNQQSSACALFAPSGREVLSAGDKGVVVLWNVNSGKEIRRFQTPGAEWGPVEQMIISRDGKRLITICMRAATSTLGVALWDVESGRLIRQFYDRGEQIVGFSPVDETFITIRAGKPDELWDGADGKIIRRYDSSTTASDAHTPCDILVSGHTLYGTASGGNGALFKVNTDGTGFEIVHGFTAARSPALTNHDGTAPQGLIPASPTLQGMILSGNRLYGTAQSGGDAGHGTIFTVKTNGKDFRVLHSFKGSDGGDPAAELVLSDRTLYGTTQTGGSGSNGTVFRVNADGAGFAVLHHFSRGIQVRVGAASNGFRWTNIDGSQPGTGVVLSGHTLFGATMRGGEADAGTVFRVHTDGTGFAVLHEFAPWSVVNDPRRLTNSDGMEVQGVVLASNTLYGTASWGGANGRGTVFKVNTDGTDFAVLKSFPAAGPEAGTNWDGGNPGSLFLSGNTLYGKPSEDLSEGPGTAVFKIGLDGTGFAMVRVFANSDEAGPLSGLVADAGGIYGTTMFGGKEGGGIVFRVNTDGTGFRVIHRFSEKWRLIPQGLSD